MKGQERVVKLMANIHKGSHKIMLWKEKGHKLLSMWNVRLLITSEGLIQLLQEKILKSASFLCWLAKTKHLIAMKYWCANPAMGYFYKTVVLFFGSFPTCRLQRLKGCSESPVETWVETNPIHTKTSSGIKEQGWHLRVCHESVQFLNFGSTVVLLWYLFRNIS